MPTRRSCSSARASRRAAIPGSREAADAAAELFESRAVAESAIRNLGLDETAQELLDRLDVEAHEGSSLVRIEAEAPSKEQARRTAQEVAEVATVLFNDRFAPETTASVWEPASADERTCVAEHRQEPRARHPDRGAGGPRLRDRRPLPRSSFAAAARGRRRLRRRRAPRRRARHRPRRRLRSQPRRPSRPRQPPATGPSSCPRFGEWTVGDVERLLAEQGDAFPEQREELELYLDTFRTVAGPDGRLPGDVDLVIEDVFADLIERAR